MFSERVVSQLLTELDGIQTLSSVVVLAATNRMDMIDPALLRAGRFDKLLYIPTPDEDARKEILKIHTKGKPLADDIELSRIADLTDGLSGADLVSIANTAVSIVLQDFIGKFPNPGEASKHVKDAIVTMQHFEDAIRQVKSSRDGKLEKAPVPYYR